MAIDRKKLGALVDKHAEKKAPPKKPGGGGGGNPSAEHVADEAAEEGDSVEHEQAEHDDGDAEMAQQQASRVANDNGDEELMQLAADVDPESEEVPEFALDDDIWERAKAAVRTLEEPPADDDLAAVMVHTYDALGGELAGEGGDEEDGGGDDGEEGDEDPDAETEPFGGGE